MQEADNGGRVVIMQRDFYEGSAKHKKIRPCQKLKKKLVNGPLSECMTNKEKDYLTNYEVREHLFYG